VASMICFVDGQPQRSRYRRFRIRGVTGANDLAMMEETVRRRYERLRTEGLRPPDLVLVDGGPGQVATARRVLDAVGLGDVPVAGLAKRFEEIHLPGGGAPVHLPRDSRGLQVLQHLRDEAHRFALTYHRLLRARRIQESRLDDVPGIGPALKRRLLARFGSVRRLARASDAELAEVPGIGARLVAAIRHGLAPGGDTGGATFS